MISKINSLNIPQVQVLHNTSVSNANINQTQPVSVPISVNKTVSYTQNFGNAVSVKMNTQLRNADEQKKFIDVSNALDSKTKDKLNLLLKNGRLLSSDANDGSTTLDNLYKVITDKRVSGLDSKSLLKDIVVALANPFAITQKFGDIPKPVEQEILNNPSLYSSPDLPYTNYLESIKNAGRLPKPQPITKDILNVVSSSCVAASIQFNLADKNPAEYARMAEQLSSEKHSVTKNIKLTDIAPQVTDAVWLLQEFKVPYKKLGGMDIGLEISPDRNAIIRARIQASEYRDKGERSPVDVLMQSAFMNIGSQHTYNAITDTRTGLFNPDNRGLTDIEKNLAEVIVEGRNKISATYQILDEAGRIVGYERPFEKILSHIKSALSLGENVIVGYTHTDSSNKVVNGHEITIVGIERDKNGKEVFVCNDTDDMKDEPIRYRVDYLLPKIHHAGLPQTALKGDEELIAGWSEVLSQYRTAV